MGVNGKQERQLENSTSRSLIVRLQDNELPAWNEMVVLYSPLILFWCRKLGVSDQDCSDLTQEVFRAVVGNISEFRQDRQHGTFRGWLRIVTRNKVRDHFRRHKKTIQAIGGSVSRQQLAQTPDEDDQLIHDEDELREEHSLFLRAISHIREDFTDQTWNAFWEVTVNGRNATEAAELLGMKSGAVRVAKSRVLKRLRNQLGDLLE